MKLARRIRILKKRLIIRYNAYRRKKAGYDTDVDGGFTDEWRLLP